MIKNRWLEWVVVGIPALMLLATASGKLLGAALVVQSLTALNLGQYTTLLGVVEVVCVLLYLVPATRNIGFFLVCSQLGGAMIAHLSHGQSILAPAFVLALVWFAMFLTRPEIFYPAVRR